MTVPFDFALAATRHSHRKLAGVVYPGVPTPHSYMDTTGSPRFLESLNYPFATLRDPGRLPMTGQHLPLIPGLRVYADCGPRRDNNEDTDIDSFEAVLHAA